jgi:hypothetical protein
MNDISLIETIIDLFKLFCNTHPNIAHTWIAYLGLKKRHYAKDDIEQAMSVLNNLYLGLKDIKRDDLMRLLLYSASMNINYATN